MKLVAVLLAVLTLASSTAASADSHRDPHHPPPEPPRYEGPSMEIRYLSDEREIHVYASTKADWTYGHAILIQNPIPSSPPIVRVQIVTDNFEGGAYTITDDFPLYSETIPGPGGSGGPIKFVEEIYYHGYDGVDQFSNYTDVPMWATGSDGDDFFLGGGGTDELYGGPGNDTIRGGDSADRIFGNGGHDRLEGDAGDDTISGSSGDDTIDGGSGDDTIEPGAGSDKSYGQSGDDKIIEYPASSPESNLLCGHDGADYLRGASGAGTTNQLDGELGGSMGDGDVDTLIGWPISSTELDRYDYDPVDPVENIYMLGLTQIYDGAGDGLFPTMIMCG